MAKKLKEKAGPRKGGNASQELRQAVLDLGGDEEDLKLISGVDENDEEPQAPSTKVKGKGKEKQSSQAEKGNSGEVRTQSLTVECELKTPHRRLFAQPWALS